MTDNIKTYWKKFKGRDIWFANCVEEDRTMIGLTKEDALKGLESMREKDLYAGIQVTDSYLEFLDDKKDRNRMEDSFEAGESILDYMPKGDRWINGTDIDIDEDWGTGEPELTMEEEIEYSRQADIRGKKIAEGLSEVMREGLDIEGI